MVCGCGPHRPQAPATGTYGLLTNPPPLAIVSENRSAFPSQPWTNGDLALIHTELSPATLFHSQSKTLSFFTPLAETGLGGPTFAAISTQQGPKIFKPGDLIEPLRMRESWFVVWFSGASGWTNWDSPWFLTLQHRPTKIRFDTNGLHFTFADEAGYAALMPIYGYYKPAQLAQQSLPFYQTKEKKKRVLTWEWFKALPADPLARARYWASVLREFPIACDERFSVDRGQDSVTLRQTFQWLSWTDDWKTEHLKLAPISPVLALAYKEGFPARFSKQAFDMEIPTIYGPLYGVEGTDSYEVTLPVLRYVNETAGTGSATGWSNSPCFEAWQQAHASNTWDEMGTRWPALRKDFRLSATTGWATFGKAEHSAVEHAANALGAARLAYRFGDAETYALACERFARELTGLVAQQRGLNYFRERQPWHSMQPLDSTLSLSQSLSTSTGAIANLPPDLARIGQAAQPMAREAMGSSTQKLERLIPGYSPTPLLRREGAMNDVPEQGLVYTLKTETSEEAGTHAKPVWPRMTWPFWKTPSGAAWNFGRVEPSTNVAATVQTAPLNSTTRVTVYRTR